MPNPVWSKLRLHWRVTVLVLVAMVLASCGGNISLPTASLSPTPLPPTATPLVATLPKLDDVHLRVMMLDDPVMEELLKQRIIDFETITNAHVTLSSITPEEQRHMETKIIAPTPTTRTASTRSISAPLTLEHDVLILPPALMLGMVQAGLVEDLTRRVQQDTALQWEAIAPFLRTYNATYNQYIFSLPLDGNVLLVYYRHDLLNEANIPPPQTWEDYIAIARYFHGRDLNGDSVADYGSCIALHDQVHDVVWAIAGNFLQSMGTQQGIFFDPDTMQPFFRNDGFGLVLDTLRTIATYGPPTTMTLDYPTIRNLFVTGRCVLTIDQSSMPLLARKTATSTFMDNVGVVMLPGSSCTLDRTTGRLTPCTPTTCPYAIDGVNHAPYVASGSWSGAINAGATPTVRDAGYALLSYLSQPIRQDTPSSSMVYQSTSPYRTTQFTDTTPLTQMGMSHTFATRYLQAVEASMTSENVVLDMRIPQSRRYEDVLVDKSITEFLGGIISRDQAIERMGAGWERITDEAGRDEQRRAYRASLGLGF